MSDQTSVKKNVFFNMLFQILVTIAPIVTTPYISRTIGADGVGTYSFTLSNVTYFTLCTALGTVAYGTREISRNRNDKKQMSKLFLEIELLTVFASIVCLLFWGVFILITRSYRLYYIILTLSIIATVLDISWLYAGIEKFKYTVTQNAIFKILGIISLFVFVKDKNDTPVYVLIMTLTTLLGNLSMWFYLPRFVTLPPVKSLRVFRHFKEVIIYFIPTVAISIYTVLDKTLIGIITHSEYENGYYEQATRIINMVKNLTFYSINVVLGARITYLFVEKKSEEIKRRIYQSIDVIFLIGYGSIFGLSAIADRLIPLYLGDGFDDVVKLIYWMCPLVIIVGVSNCLGFQYYTPAGLRTKSARYIITGSLVNLILNLILIPKYGTVGAVIGSIMAEATISALYLFNCDHYLSLNNLLQLSSKRVIAGSLMLLIVRMSGTVFTHNSISNLIILVAIGTIAYALILLSLRDTLTIESFHKIRKKISKR